MKKNNKKGFTLMEMLIVVAIIAILVAIAIPVLNSALEKSREAADAGNIRSAYAECTVAAMTGVTDDDDVTKGDEDDDHGYAYYKDVDCTQKNKGWINSSIESIGGLDISEIDAEELDGWTVTVYEDGYWTCEETEDSTGGSGN